MTTALLLLLSLAPVRPAWAQDPSPEATAGRLVQEELPALAARQQAAEARAAAARAWFAGEGSWQQAFPGWEHRPLLDPASLVAARAELVQQASRRAAERVAPVSPALDETARTTLVQARAATADAEDAADQLALRFLAGLEAGLAGHPELAAPALGAWIEDRVAAAEAARTRLVASPTDAGALATVQAADRLAALHGGLEQALIALWTVPGTAALALWTPQALASEVDAPELWVPLLPLLSTDDQDAAQSRLTARAETARQTEIQTLRARVETLTITLTSPAPTPSEDLAALERALSGAELTLDLAAAARAEAGDEERAALALEVARLERDLARSRLTRAQEQAAGETVSDQEAEQAADAAARAAEEAQARVEAQSARGRDATLERRLKTQRDQVALVRKTDVVLRNAARDARESLGDRLDELQAAGASARALPPLSKERQPALDSAYRDSRRLVDDVRAEVRSRQTAVSQWRASTRRLEQDLAAFREVDPGSGLAAAWRTAGRELEAAVVDREERELADLDRALILLSRARDERAMLRRRASAEARAEDTLRIREELTTEILEVPVHLGAIGRRATGAVEQARTQVGDLAAVQRFLAGLAGTLLLLGLWVLVRPRLEQTLRTLILEARGRRGRTRTTDLLALVRPAEPVLTLGGDALVAAVLLGALGPRWPLFRVLLWVFLVQRLVQVIPLAVRLAFATPRESRAALSVTTPAVRDLLALTARWAVLWWGVLALVDVVLGQVLWAERLSEWVHNAGRLVGVGLACWLIWLWGPTVEERVRAAEDPNAFVAWLARAEGGFTMRAVRAVLGTCWLLLAWVARLLDSRERTSWIGSLLARRHLRESAGQGIQPPPLEVLDRLRAQQAAPGERTTDLDTLEAHYEDWRAEGVEGLLAVIGDRGAGKGHLLQAAAPIFAEHLDVRHLQPPEHHLRGGEGVAWLAEATGSGACVDGPALEAALLQQKPTAWLVDDLHRLFLRRVGGFEALQDVLVVFRQTAHHHLWVVSCHAPTWQYLAGVRLRVPLEAFRAVVRLEPLGPEPLADWILSRTAQAELQPDFRALSTASTLGGDPQLALQRATNAYWRLLADSSEGNPEVAYELWLGSLHRGRAAGRVGVGLPPTPTADRLSALADADLFVLAALIVHDGLPLTALTEVLNMPTSQVRTSVRTLLAHGVLSAVADNAPWYVRPPWRPTVHRMLRQKHVLRGRA